jgi:uncharacterized protein
MLKVDLVLLARQRRAEIEVELPPGDPVWEGTGLAFAGPVRIQLDVQYAGSDIVVRGQLGGTAKLSCRRCTTALEYELAEDLTFVYRPGITTAEAEAEELYPLPERGQELDLTPAVREHALLAVPEYVNCSEECRGFCPRCGTNLNRASCECVVEDEDPRWAALRRLRTE